MKIIKKIKEKFNPEEEVDIQELYGPPIIDMEEVQALYGPPPEYYIKKDIIKKDKIKKDKKKEQK